ncbi:hypothetical protein [Myceligenerans pegani]|uniref:Uncharacterized protein n=1 Tax=Myceligenerans pegani TaxID=2776917 RepID=A0ABR9N1E3_9MICO|nr:hypothetical protein [Myceligenerans sp. TRM 65318]MBE1876832.1 hypothetical protein [Myceligenerans sp. TRM 65318]MBE3019103.1 hypothetical protein [Myceligenerans sp. TRM 65318]
MSAEHARDAATAAVVLAVFAGLWFAWARRHIRGLWMLVPIVGMVSAVVVAVSGTLDVIGAWDTGTAVDGGTIGLYVVALGLQAVVTRVITGFLASRDLTNLVPTVVALSLTVHLVVLAELLWVDDLYLVALICLAAIVLAWPIAAVGRFMTPSGAPMTHATTGILMGVILLGAAARALV